MLPKNCTVLIVNDSWRDRTTYRSYLQQETSFAYTVWEAESTEAALRLCSSQPPDSIVLDYLLPDRDGLEFLSSLKTSIGENCPPVIMLNEQGNETIAIQAFKAGVEDYLIKDEITSESLRYVTRTAIENFRLRQELRKSEERFRTSIENMFDCFGIYTAIRAEDTGAIVDFKFEYLNAAALQSNRMTVDDLGKSLCEVLPAHRESGLFSEYCRVVETGEPLVKDCLIYSDQFGDQYLTRAYNVQIRKLDDGLVASWRDITEQKQSEVALQQSEERYRAVVEDQTELICRFLPDCSLTFVNGAYSRYFDSTPTELIGQNFLDLIPESDRSLVQQQIAQLSAATPENGVIVQEHQVLKPNGDLGWQQWTNRAIFDDDGQLVEFQAVGRDITERKKAELALQKANECFEIAAAINCLIYDYDLRQNVIERSQGLTKLFGYSLSESEPTAEWWYERIHPSQREAIQEAKRAALLGTEVSVYLEYQVRHRDQHYVWVADRVCILRDESGQAVRIIGSTTDITERKLAEQQLRESEALLQLGVRVAGVALARFDYATNTVELSPEAAVLYGFSTAESIVTRDRLHATFHPEEREMLEGIIQQVLDPVGDGWFELEHRVVLPHGEVRWLYVRKQVFFEPSGNASLPQSAILAAIDITDRKQAEALVQHQLAQIEAIYGTAPVGLCFLDRERRFMQINERLAEINGLSVSEHIGRTVSEILPQLAEIQEPIFEQVLQTGMPVLDVEVQGTTPAQPEVERYWLANYYPLKTADGESLGINITVKEITERKLAEQQLRESEALLQLGVRVAGIALVRFDYATNTVKLSPEAAVLYGLPTDELTVTRDRLHATFHPEEREMLEGIIQQVLDPTGDGWFDQEHRVVWPNGEVRWLYVRKQVFFEPSGNVSRPQSAILAAIDITERKQAEASLQDSERKFSAVFDQTFQLMGLVSVDGILFDINQAALDSINAQSSEIIGKSFWETPWWHSEELQNQLREAIAQAANGQTIRYQVQFFNAQDDITITDFSLKPVVNEIGEVIMLIAEGRDITERIQAEREREQLLAETQSARTAAEEANRSKDEFVAVIAHELRSPINSVAGWTQILQTRRSDPVIVDRALAAIKRGTQTQVQLIEDLLDISRIACGTLRLTFAPLNLTTVMQAAISLVRPMADAKQIELETQFTAIAQISGDLNRLQQIAVNLLTNAIKFTPEQGHVTISVELVEQQVSIQVKDSGKGISPEFLPQIFEQFQQGQKQSGSKDGLGLGLAIVKNLVELHHGTITAESSGLGQGATFTVWLPLHESQPVVTPTEIPPVTVENPLAGIRILAIDDQPDSLELLQFILENAGAEVQTATSAVVALDLISQFDFDLLVSDIAMPDINGHELIQQIQTLYPERRIRAIALTAYASSSDRDYALRIGFEQYFSKPFEPAILIAAIVNLIHPS